MRKWIGQKERVVTDFMEFELQFQSFTKQSNKYQLIMSSSFDFFSQLCAKVSNKSYFEQLMIKQQEFFDIQPYKIDKLYGQSAKRIYRQICTKYEITKEIIIEPNIWHQNERKIFIWFVVCYFYQIGVQDPIEVQIQWQDFSHIFFHKTPTFLRFQFLNIIKLKKRIIWTPEEDQLLIKAIQTQGLGKWNQISKNLFFKSPSNIFKSPKHCRQRWLNHLDKNKNKGKWTDEQDYKIVTYVKENGKKWSKIVQVLNQTRTEHMIKNRFNSLVTKNRKNKKQKQPQTLKKIIKLLEKQLHLNPLTQQQSVFYENKQVNFSEENIQYDQKFHRGILDNQIKSEKYVNKFSIEIPGEVREKEAAKESDNLEMSSFETLSLWESLSNFYQSYLMKNEQNFDLPYNYSFLSSIPQLIQKQQLQPEPQIYEIMELNEGAWNGLVQGQKTIYKTYPVYIIQKNP